MRFTLATLLALAVLPASAAEARELAAVKRIDARTVELSREGTDPVAVWLSDDTLIDAGDHLVAPQSKAATLRIDIPQTKRRYVILQREDGSTTVAAERLLPLEQGSNFRDIGGYVTKDGETVRWGKVYRSGAMPMLSEADYALLSQIDLDSIVDLRSLDERVIAPDLLDDRTGALFLANDYSMKPLMEGLTARGGEDTYQGLEKMLVPQYRMIFRRILAGDGAVMYHCSAGQDRTGVATALIYDTLGVDRETILRDYHLSTAFRRTEWEMPKIDPEDYPGNFIVRYYASAQASGNRKPQPLYAPSGASHLAQFFTYLDKEYGGSEGYLKREIGLSDEDIVRLREIMLD
ncbi:MAG: tyrosine-protein phosphatase [Novosphingobium sp.]|nr:tyrosine-protein phosphatase [Novosphingobium sp.]